MRRLLFIVLLSFSLVKRGFADSGFTWDPNPPNETVMEYRMYWRHQSGEKTCAENKGACTQEVIFANLNRQEITVVYEGSVK